MDELQGQNIKKERCGYVGDRMTGNNQWSGGKCGNRQCELSRRVVCRNLNCSISDQNLKGLLSFE